MAELQTRFVNAANNKQEGTDAGKLTPEFQAGYRQSDVACSAVSLNFERYEIRRSDAEATSHVDTSADNRLIS